MEEVVKFLKDADEYYLATMDGDQPRVRPFGTAHVFENRLYIQTGKRKEVSREIHNNPKVEICALKNGEWLRVSGELIEDDRLEGKVSMPKLTEYVQSGRRQHRSLLLQKRYSYILFLHKRTKNY